MYFTTNSTRETTHQTLLQLRTHAKIEKENDLLEVIFTSLLPSETDL
jgi:hypothetical protein